jgi:hypothetical protein
MVKTSRTPYKHRKHRNTGNTKLKTAFLPETGAEQTGNNYFTNNDTGNKPETKNEAKKISPETNRKQYIFINFESKIRNYKNRFSNLFPVFRFVAGLKFADC